MGRPLNPRCSRRRKNIYPPLGPSAAFFCYLSAAFTAPSESGCPPPPAPAAPSVAPTPKAFFCSHCFFVIALWPRFFCCDSVPANSYAPSPFFSANAFIPACYEQVSVAAGHRPSLAEPRFWCSNADRGSTQYDVRWRRRGSCS